MLPHKETLDSNAIGVFASCFLSFVQIWAYERELMLMWLDSVWSVFLEDIESLKKAVYVKVSA